MSIGYLQDIIFTVSENKVLTFQELSHSSSAKFQEHEVLGNKPITEFLGLDLDKISLNILLQRSLGIDIQTYLDKIKTYEQTGEPLILVIGSKIIGCDKWVIESSSKDYGHIYQNGGIHSVTIDLNLKEYLSSSEYQPNRIINMKAVNKSNNINQTIKE